MAKATIAHSAAMLVVLACIPATAQTPPVDKAAVIGELHDAASTPLAAPNVPLPGQAKPQAFNLASTEMLVQLKDAGIEPVMIDRFLAAGGHLEVVPAPKALPFPAIYDNDSQEMRVGPEYLNGTSLASGLTSFQLGRLAHEFWHAYKAQVVNKGFDPDTELAFTRLKQWLIEQDIKLDDDPAAKVQHLNDVIGLDGIDDFAEEYAGYLIFGTAYHGPYLPGQTADALYDTLFNTIASQQFVAYVNGPDKVNYRVLAPPPLPFLKYVFRLVVSADALPAAVTMDACLVGSWDSNRWQELGAFSASHFTGGGSGVHLTFGADGSETVDYGKMAPLTYGAGETISITGTAGATVATGDGKVTLREMKSHAAIMTTDSAALGKHFSTPLQTLGPGGLGSAKDKPTYTCGADTLQFFGSAARDGHATAELVFDKAR